MRPQQVNRASEWGSDFLVFIITPGEDMGRAHRFVTVL
jgi:hypothetical protein